MLGAIAGDIAGSSYEHQKVSGDDFDLFPASAHFTDDTVLTVAVADAILEACASSKPDYRKFIHEYGREWPGRGYGGMFRHRLRTSDPQPYNSFGNGSGMRVIAITRPN